MLRPREAIALYRSRLAPGGVIALHATPLWTDDFSNILSVLR